jgi:hypothetical protein
MQENINIGSDYQQKIGPQGVTILLQHITWNIQNMNLTMHQIGN